MADHLPKKLLNKLQVLQDQLQDVIDLPTGKKQSIASKKLMGAELYRIMDELQQHPQAFLSGIEPADMDDPASIKKFLYRMQQGGRKARDTLNTVPSKLSPLFNQHHGAFGLAGVRSAYKGLNINESIDQGLRIRDFTGTKPGSHNQNLFEILSRDDVHKGAGHGGNFNDPLQRLNINPGVDFEGMKSELERVYDLNMGRSNKAAELTKTSGIPDFLDSLKIIGEMDPNIDLSQGKVTEETAAQSRSAISKGTKALKAATGLDASTPKSFLQILQDNYARSQVDELVAAANNPLARRMSGLLPVLGTTFGATFMDKVAEDRDKEIKDNPNDASLKINKALDQISGWGDRTSMAGMGLLMGGDMASLAGIPVMAAGEATSLTSGLGSLAIDAARQVPKSLSALQDKAIEMKKSVAHKNNPNDYGITEALRINGPNQLKIFADLQGALRLGSR